MIQTASSKWRGTIEEVAARPKSGANLEGQMISMFSMYHANNEDQEFRFLHVFSQIELCENCREVRFALDKANETYESDARAPLAAEGRRDDTKKSRATRDATPATKPLQALIQQCIADTKSSAPKRKEKSVARWSALMVNQHANLDLKRTNVTAKKRNTDLTFLIGADTSTMDE
ncbi:putative methionyl-tRNA synthetase [Hordeum vulgare]|nr:putative methionyl-tRNA synthetase [Hordeum vulgare]